MDFLGFLLFVVVFACLCFEAVLEACIFRQSTFLFISKTTFTGFWVLPENNQDGIFLFSIEDYTH